VAARVALFDDGPARTAFDTGVIGATAAIIATQMVADSDRWVRSSAGEIETFRAGASRAGGRGWLAADVPVPRRHRHPTRTGQPAPRACGYAADLRDRAWQKRYSAA